MIIVEEAIAWPINHVTIKCFKNQNYCQLDQIQLDTRIQSRGVKILIP